MIKCISLTNPKVLELYESAQHKSRMVETAILFYEENKESILTKEDIRQVIKECIGSIDSINNQELNEDNILNILNL
ncbi:hypothetical protein J2Z76_000422 [Sedimentibacter acidaminivorans]|uniref:EF-hand domain-containing protein n=1 Tax=Sedimentibacter acidaminivorans TaxID=913099 RepID=A0ABS4GA61_9FIRM|nr:hypothetical protein [Sedimentibacter acidaminivorans]MBP1924569.1 hypothetical protein [Sedimentibacter acidaminivorans]